MRRDQRNVDEFFQEVLLYNFNTENPSAKELNEFHEQIDNEGADWDAIFRNMHDKGDIRFRSELIVLDLCVIEN